MNSFSICDFLKTKEKELALCKKLLEVNSNTNNKEDFSMHSNTNNKEDFSMPRQLIETAEDLIEECVQLMSTYTEPDPGGIRSTRLLEAVRIINNSIKMLKKQTCFFGSTMLYEDSILTDLEKAIVKFKETAD